MTNSTKKTSSTTRAVEKPTAFLLAVNGDAETFRIPCWFCKRETVVTFPTKIFANWHLRKPFKCEFCNKSATYSVQRKTLKKKRTPSPTPSMFDESGLPERPKKKKKADDDKH